MKVISVEMSSFRSRTFARMDVRPKTYFC